MSAAVAIGAVIVDGQGRVLLVKRANPPLANAWTILGGKPEAGEPLEAAVAREVAEETGLEVDVRALIEVVHLAREGFAYAIHEFLCVPRDAATAPVAGSDALDVAWVYPQDLERFGVLPDARAVIARALALPR